MCNQHYNNYLCCAKLQKYLMLAKVFEKTNPINYLMLLVFLLIMTLAFSFQKNSGFILSEILTSFGIFLILSVGLYINEKICHNNSITKNNSYAFLLAVLFMMMIPNVFVNWQVVVSVIFVLIGFYQLLNMDNTRSVKQNIFDASFLILAAVIFEFWAFIFMLMVYVSIVISAMRDYRNWIVPIVSLVFVSIIFVAISKLFDLSWKNIIVSQFETKFKLDVFESSKEHVGFSFLAALVIIFIVFMMFNISSKPLNKQNLYKKILFSTMLGFLVFVISSQKQASQMLFVVFPASILGANYIESISDKKFKNFVLWVIFVIALLMYINQI